MNAVHFIVPEGINDTTRPSGGNTYDRKLIDALHKRGIAVVETPVSGSWPVASIESLGDLAAVLSAVTDGGVVLIDGIITSAASEVLIPHATRLRLVILMHMPLGSQPAADVSVQLGERISLTAAIAVITTSSWTQGWLTENYKLAPASVYVAEPGVEPAAIASASSHGGRLVCVAAVVPHKGHDTLVEALATLSERDWDCRFIGSSTLEIDFVAQLRRRLQETQLSERIQFTGPLVGASLSSAYASADLLIAPSRMDTYGMVLTEAFARGIPVVASEVGGLPMTLGFDGEHNRPGMLVPTDDPIALARAIATWLDRESHRQQLRGLALIRRRTLNSWTETASVVAQVLEAVAA